MQEFAHLKTKIQSKNLPSPAYCDPFPVFWDVWLHRLVVLHIPVHISHSNKASVTLMEFLRFTFALDHLRF
jgi:hypothetical protein